MRWPPTPRASSVASAAALLTKLPDPASILLSSCEIKPGIDIDPHELANTLVLGGYEPADPVDAHGEFARRGGILDVFPAGEELPIRIEFIGDTVESIRRFDPGTQRSVETLDRFGIVPVREGDLSPGHGPVTGESVSVPAYARCASVGIRANRCGKAHQDRLGTDRHARTPMPSSDRRGSSRSQPTDLIVTEEEIAAELGDGSDS